MIELVDEEEEEEEPNEPILAPTLDDLSWSEDDKTLNDLLSNLHSTKVRRIHKYTDEQLALMHKHHEFNRMLQSYVDVSLYNGQLKKVRRLVDELLIDQERRQSMKNLSWRYISTVNVFNSLFFAYAERVSSMCVCVCRLIECFVFSLIQGESSSDRKSIRKNASTSN